MANPRGKELTQEEILSLLNSPGSNRGRKRDTSEPRTTDNWWHQTHRLIHRPSYPDIDVKCANTQCPDPRPDDVSIILGEVKGTLMCRYCFLDGWLSNVV